MPEAAADLLECLPQNDSTEFHLAEIVSDPCPLDDTADIVVKAPQKQKPNSAHEVLMTPCHECVLRPRCGGLVKDGEAEYTCMLRCGQCRDKHGNCPFACPNNEARFTMMVGEVKSLTYKPVTKLVSPQAANWPLFAPQIYHGSRRSRPLHVECVSISIKSLLAETKPGDGPRELCKIFKLEDSHK